MTDLSSISGNLSFFFNVICDFSDIPEILLLNHRLSVTYHSQSLLLVTGSVLSTYIIDNRCLASIVDHLSSPMHVVKCFQSPWH